MGRPCTACRHPDRVEIDRDLASGVSYRNVLEHAPDLSLGGLSRHHAHLARELAVAARAGRMRSAEDVLARLAELEARAERLLDRAERGGRVRDATTALREARSCLATFAGIAVAVEERRQKLTPDEAEAASLAEALRLVLPDHPTCAADLARALAQDGQAELASAVESLVSRPALTV